MAEVSYPVVDSHPATSSSGKERARLWSRRKHAKRRALIDAAKERPCADCGIGYPPYVMDFDHRPGEEKKFNISDGIFSRYRAADVEAEMAKCDVVCSNCHRLRTRQRLVGGK